MGIFSWTRSRYRRRFRKSYNEGRYKNSLRSGRISYTIFRDRVGLDVAARSALRLRRYDLATRLYRIASRRGWQLRDHKINHFEAELKSGNLLPAFNIAMKMESRKEGRNPFQSLSREIMKTPVEDRREILKTLNSHHNLPDELASLAPQMVRKVPEQRMESSSYTMLDSDDLNLDRYRREILRVRDSAPYKIGKHLSNAYRKPWLIPLLPITLPILALRVRSEKTVLTDGETFSVAPVVKNPPSRKCIVMFPTNGVGFGHFTRLLALARRLKKMDSELEIIFFTTMPTLQPLEDEGFPTYHIPGRYRYDDMDPKEWNSIAEEMLSMVFNIHRPCAFVFDGSYPYRGMLNAINSNRSMLKIWLRRGAIRKGSKSLPEDSLGHFDAVIRPGDSVPMEIEDEDEGGIPVVTCNPILLLDEEDMTPLGDLRKRLDIPKEATVAYVQLGAGRINNINSELRFTLESLNFYEHVYTVFGESTLGERFSFDYDRIRTLRDYPNSMYFGDFDLAIMASGYNSFHEAIQSGLPTICYPNLKTGRDDQLARAMVAQEAECMIVLEKRNKRNIAASIDRMMDPDVRKLMKMNSSIIRRENGAEQAASWILDQLPNHIG